MTRNIYTPEGFDPRAYLPPRLWKYADAASYLVHAIEANRVYYHRKRTDFNPLKAAYLNAIMGRWQAKDIRTALATSGVIEIDRQYFVGQKSRGYRLGPVFLDAVFRRHGIGPKLAKKLKKHKMHDKLTLPVHKYLHRWLTRLEVDYDAAMNSFPTREELIDKHVVLTMLADRQFFMVPDDYGRLHSNVSCLSRTLRPYLHFGPDKLVMIDLKNSQPFFFSVLLLNYFAHDRSLDSFYNTPRKKEERGRGKGASITIDNLSRMRQRRLVRMDLPEDVRDYISLTERGVLYEELVPLFGMNDRNDAKDKFFKGVLFPRPHPNKFRFLFGERFPTVAQVIDDLKAKDHARLSHHLQRCESAVMIHAVCDRLRVELPDAPVLTIHDCLMTTKPHLEPVRAVLKDEFKSLSLSPTVAEQDFTLAA